MARNVTIFDPPMCCSTGVCGPGLDPRLLAIQAAILQLQELPVTLVGGVLLKKGTYPTLAELQAALG